MNKKKTLSEKLRDLTYMQVAMALFVFAAVLFILCIALSLATGGQVGWIAAAAGLVALVLSLAGLAVTLYGHFAVGMEGKLNWKWGLFLNGAVFVLLLALYILGLIVK